MFVSAERQLKRLVSFRMRINAADLLLVKWNRPPTTKGKAAGKRGTSQLVFPKKNALCCNAACRWSFPFTCLNVYVLSTELAYLLLKSVSSGPAPRVAQI